MGDGLLASLVARSRFLNPKSKGCGGASSQESTEIGSMRDHTNLIAWRLAKRVVKEVVTLCECRWRPSFSAMYGQLKRSSLSVQLNITEGYGLKEPRQKIRHYRIAYGSCLESADVLELLVELGESAAEPTNATCRECCRVLLGLIRRERKLLSSLERLGPPAS